MMHMELLKLIESIRSPFFDAAFGLITRLGEESVVVAVLCAVFWCINKKTTYITGMSFFLSGLTVQGMKICFRVERPWVIDPSMSPVASAMAHSTGYSFPSGHTQSATALFGALFLIAKRIPQKLLCVVIIFFVAFSRMYLGVHTIYDVTASVAVGVLFIFLTFRFVTFDAVVKKHELIRTLILLLYCAAAIAIAAGLHMNGLIEKNYLSDCLKAAGAGIGFAVGMYIERVYIDFSVRTKSIFGQIVKYAAGLAGVIVILQLPKLLPGMGFIVDITKYFLLLMWVMALYPLIIKARINQSCTDS